MPDVEPFKSNGHRTALLYPGAEQNDLQGALQRIKSLESALERSQAILAKTQESLYGIYTSSGWKILTRYCALRNFIYPGYVRLLSLIVPERSHRRRLASLLSTALIRLNQRLIGFIQRPRLRSINAGYRRWIEQNEPGPRTLERQRHTLLFPAPLISVLVALDDPEPGALEATVRSVQDQTYRNWELCLGGARSEEAEALLRALALGDPRVRVQDAAHASTGAEASIAALAQSTGDFLALLNQGDTLAPFALFEVVRALRADPEAEVLYSDEDRIEGATTRRRDPLFKPDWSPDALYSHYYLGNLLVLRRSLVNAVGGFRRGYEGALVYDLALRTTARARKIVHVARVLCHARHGAPTSAAADFSAGRALEDHLDRDGVNATVRPGLRAATWEVRYRHARRPLVSIIIPNRDFPEGLAKCVESIRRSTYTPYEIIVVENHSVRAETFDCYRRLQSSANLRLLTWDQPFNYAAINNFAAAHVCGDVLLFLNNDMEVINADWLERLLEHALRPEVGAVGAKLYYPDDTVQHAGVVIGIREILGHGHRHFPRTSAGYANRLVTVQNVSAVTGACLMIRKAAFHEVGGFEEQFALDFNDIDLCLKLRRQGYRIVWTPYAELYHFESKTRGYAVTQAQQIRFLRDTALFHELWASTYCDGDPFYNPNLTHDREDFSLRVERHNGADQ
jgi:GT2 family glycosyltransferase